MQIGPGGSLTQCCLIEFLNLIGLFLFWFCSRLHFLKFLLLLGWVLFYFIFYLFIYFQFFISLFLLLWAVLVLVVQVVQLCRLPYTCLNKFSYSSKTTTKERAKILRTSKCFLYKEFYNHLSWQVLYKYSC